MLHDFRAFQLSQEFYRLCKPLKIPVFLKDQLMRASASVALNLAESAAGRRTDKERIRFFTISLGSLRECQAILALEEIKDEKLKDLSDQLGRILFKLCRLDAKPTSEKQILPP
jgi:four helix bundle protein